MSLTEKSVLKLAASSKRMRYMDDEVTGFGVRVEPHARKSFFWCAKVDGEVYYKALGEFPAISVKDARDSAKEWAGKAAKWKQAGYPQDENPLAKRKRIEPTSAPTFRELVKAYTERHVKETANNPVRASYDVNLMATTHFETWLDRKLDELTVEDVLAVKNKCGKHCIAANRSVEFIRRLFNWSGGKKDGTEVNFWPVENIAKDVSTYDEKPRKRFLQPDELVRFNDELENEKHIDLKDFLVLAITTGARRGDLFSMRWKDIQWEREVWSVPYPKNGESYDVQLLDVAVNVLKRRRTEIPDSVEYVFPGPGRTGHLINLKKPWDEFRKRAKLNDFRIHDIRHTCASYQSISGVSLQQIGASLGHRSTQSTQIYAHLHDEAVRAARMSGQAKMLQMMKAARKRAKITARKPKLLKAAAVGRG